MIGRTISHYRIIEKLGEGGMGVVYKAEDLDLRVTRALKFLPPHAGAGEEEQARLEREARAAASLEHPAICPVHEIGRADGHTFIVMSYLEGRTLAEQLEQDGPLPIDEVLAIVLDVAEALGRAHAAGVVHRDLKPANIMITEAARPVLMDFGLARMAAGTQLTREGAAMGTAAYMAPEQARGGTVDARTDIWALGVTMYEILAGRKPFASDFDHATLYAVLHEEPVALQELRRDVPYALEQIVERCLAKAPERRFGSIDELRRELASLQDELTAGQRVERFVRLRRLRRRRRFLLGVAATVVIVAGVAGWFIHSSRSMTISAIAVLPFFNLSGDPAQQFFADGMTDALISELQQLSAGADLRVIGRTSVMRYRETDKSLPEIARELDVDAVVEASVARQGDEVRIVAKLIRARPEQQIWADSFERGEQDVFRLHAEIASMVADQIALALTPEAEERLARRAERTVDPRAYERYLQARHYFSLTTVESTRRSLELYEQAIQIDPEFALAWAGRAEAYAMYGQIYPLPPAESCAKSMEYARRALEIDDDLAEAHAVLADEILYCIPDSALAASHLQRALEINPESPTVLLYRAQHLDTHGHSEEALPAILEAQKRDPFSAFIAANVVWRYASLGQIEEAEAAYHKTLELDPANMVARWGISHIYLDLERFADAVRVLEEAQAVYFNVDAGSPEYVPQLVKAWAALGQRQKIVDLQNLLLEARARRYMPATFLACTHAGLDDEKATLAMMRDAVAENDWRLGAWQNIVRELLYGAEDPSAEYSEIVESSGHGIPFD